MSRTENIEIVEGLSNRQESLPLLSYDIAIVIGIGGIGSWVAFNMALTGKVNTMILIDGDIVEETNLNRTPYRVADIGCRKVDAMKFLILERRAINVITYDEKTSSYMKEVIQEQCMTSFRYKNKYEMQESAVIVDCRDDAISDFYDFPAKYYKLGYDGLEITLDGNPKDTPIWGRANGYRVTPSFICPSQLAANLIVTDILINQEKNLEVEKYKCDEMGKLNDSFTFNSQFLLRDLYVLTQRNIEGTTDGTQRTTV
jgi:hypothetical protein